MRAPSRRVTALAIIAVLGVVALWWLRPGARSPDAPLRASIGAARPWIGPLGSIELNAELEGVAPGTAIEYEWRSDAGFVRGSGPRPVWIAPADTGRYRVTLTARAGTRTATATLDLDVRLYPGMALDGAGVTAELDEPGYQIAEVTFDRPRLCRNDDVLVRVTASDPDGDSSWLLPVIRFPGFTAEGDQAVGRVGWSFDAEPEPIDEVQVDLIDIRTRATVATRTVPFVVEDCEEPGAGLRVQCTAAAVRDDEIVCEVHAWDEDAPAPVRYEWQVLDDEAPFHVETEQGWARLNLPPRLEHAALSSYVIAVRAHDAAGATREGRTSHVRHNTAWETSMLTGVLQLQVRFDGAPIERGDQYVTHVTIRNPFAEPVVLDALQVTRYPCGDGSARPIVEPALEPRSVLGRARLAPGEVVSYDWTMPVDPARCAAEVDLTGEGAETGLVATGLWIMPTDPDRRVAVTGADRERLRTALDLLSRRRGHRVEQVTSEELQDLVREGAIAPFDAPPPAAGPLRPGESMP